MNLYRLLCSLAAFAVITANARNHNDSSGRWRIHSFTGSFEMGGGFHGMSGGGTARVIFANEWGLAYSITANVYPAFNQPDDYKPGNVFIIFSGPSGYQDEATIHSLMLVKECHISKSSRWRVSLCAGPAISFHRIHHFTPIEESSGGLFIPWYSGNYETAQHNITTIGIMLKPGIYYKLGNRCLLQLSAVSNVNAVKTYTGIEAGLAFGWLGKRSKR